MDMITKVARLLSDRAAAECNVNKEDNWGTYSPVYRADAEAVLQLIGAEEMLAAAKKADDALTDPRIGTWSYMEGSEIYGDFREASGALRSAIDKMEAA
jgi:hypothetical protein